MKANRKVSTVETWPRNWNVLTPLKINFNPSPIHVTILKSLSKYISTPSKVDNHWQNCILP